MKKVVKAILCVILAGALVGAAALSWVVYQEAHAGDELQKSDVIIVLGARVRPDGTLSNSLEYRMQTALAAYEAGYADRFIVCGAQGGDEPCTEASAMKAYLTARGVPEASVFTDDQSFNTRQNIDHAKAIMDEQGFSTAIVVTNAYHVARAKALLMQRDSLTEPEAHRFLQRAAMARGVKMAVIARETLGEREGREGRRER